MKATITVNGQIATILGGRWESESATLKRAAEAAAEKFKDAFQLAYFPDRDAAVAEYVASELKGELTSITLPPDMPPGTIY